jgi:haloalkane dehalogenase
VANPTPRSRPAWVDDELLPFESHFIEVGPHTIHYLDEGNGPLLLLYHGNPSWSFLYRDVIKGLRAEFRCIAFDYPGMGLSSAGPGYGFRAHEHAAVAEQFIEKLDLDQITSMVQDWGGPIGLAVANRHPERHRALIVANTWGWPADTLPARLKHGFFSGLWGGPLGRFATTRFNLFARVVLPAGHKRRRLTSAELAQYLGPFPDPLSRTPCCVFPREITKARSLLQEIESGMPRLAKHPALILWADRDFAFGDRELARWQRIFESQRTRILDGAGHFLQDDAPDEICAEIRAWWPPT